MSIQDIDRANRELGSIRTFHARIGARPFVIARMNRGTGPRRVLRSG
jgi:hypothetical protein